MQARFQRKHRHESDKSTRQIFPKRLFLTQNALIFSPDCAFIRKNALVQTGENGHSDGFSSGFFEKCQQNVQYKSSGYNE